MCKEQIEIIVLDIRNGTVVAVSDGSFKDSHCTAAWVIENSVVTARLIGLVNIPPFHVDYSVYCNELGGLYNTVCIFTIIKEIWEIYTQEAEIGIRCDGLSALDKLFDINKSITVTDQQSVILSGIQGFSKSNKLRWKYKHVCRY